MQKILSSLIIVSFILSIACGGGGGNSDRELKLSATTSLRIGRSASSTSPVATSAALDSGETVIVIFDPVTGRISEVLFQTLDGETIRIVVDPTGRPTFAETGDTRISFSNLDNNSSDLIIEQNGIAVASLNVPLREESIGLLSGDEILANVLGVVQPDESRQRGFLNSAVVAVRTVGCAGQAASAQANLSSSFSNLSSSACNAQILDEILSVTTDQNQDINEITVTSVPDTGSCNSIGSLTDARNCTQTFGGKVGEASQKGTVGVFPTPTPKPQKPKPSPTPTPMMPNPPGDPLRTTFEGTWVGPTTADQITTFCSNGTLTYDIVTNGDHTCANPNCLIVGMINNIDNTVFTVNGVLNQNADIAFTTSSTIFGIPTSGSAIGHIVNDTTMTGTFQNDQGCSGSFTVNKQ